MQAPRAVTSSEPTVLPNTAPVGDGTLWSRLTPKQRLDIEKTIVRLESRSVMPSRLIQGQIDFTHPPDFILDRFLFTIVGTLYLVLLFDGWRILALLPLVIALDAVR